MSYVTEARWKLSGYCCGVCAGEVYAAPSTGAAGDRGDYLFYCPAGCSSYEVYDQEDPADYFAAVPSG